MKTTFLSPGAAAIVIMMKKKSSAEKVMGLIRDINIIYSLLSFTSLLCFKHLQIFVVIFLSEKYENLKDFWCLNILRNGSNVNVFNSLIEAKEYCSNDPNCFGVQNKTEIPLTYYACAYPSEISSSDIEGAPTQTTPQAQSLKNTQKVAFNEQQKSN